MRIKSNTFLKAREGEKKIKRVFLWLPTRFNDDPEYKWLEMANVVYSINRVDSYDIHANKRYSWEWEKIRFANDDDLRTLPLESDESSDLLDVMFNVLGRENKFSHGLDMLVILSFLLSVKFGVTMMITLSLLRITFSLANLITED